MVALEKSVWAVLIGAAVLKMRHKGTLSRCKKKGMVMEAREQMYVRLVCKIDLRRLPGQSST